jgi:uncharacterized membrane protein YbhN (UPF0104 family)
VKRALLHVLLFAVTAALVVVAARHFRGELPSLHELGRPDAGWLVVAAACEAASLLAYALIVRRLLAERGVRARTSELLRATVGGIAIGATVPGGQAFSTAYWYRLLRREGAEPGTAAVALTGAMLAGIASLGWLLVAGVGIAGGSGPLAQARIAVFVAAGAFLVVRIVSGRRLLRLVRRVVARFTPLSADDLTMRPRALATVAALAFANWLLDCACLVASLAAVGAPIPVRGVLVTYALAQIVAAIPLLPGGGGTVELSFSLGFAAFGETSSTVVAGILLFRIISCWGLVPLGWLGLAAERAPLRRLVGRRAS